MTKAAMIATVAYARRGVKAAIASPSDPEQRRDERALGDDRRDVGGVVDERAGQVARREDLAEEEHGLGNQQEHEQRRRTGRPPWPARSRSGGALCEK